MIKFDFRILYARADEHGMARRALITYSKQPLTFKMVGEKNALQMVATTNQNGLWIELAICTVVIKWKTTCSIPTKN